VVEARDQVCQGGSDGRLVDADGDRLGLVGGLCEVRFRVTPSMAVVTVLPVLVIERPSTVTWEVEPIVWALVVPGASLRAAPSVRMCP